MFLKICERVKSFFEVKGNCQLQEREGVIMIEISLLKMLLNEGIITKIEFNKAVGVVYNKMVA